MLVSVDVFAMRTNLDLDPNGQDDRLPNIQLALEQAEGIVLGYVDVPDPVWDESTVPAEVVSAIMLIAQSLLDDSKSAAMLNGMDTDEKNPVRVVLRRLRTPTLA
jgi:hypothetical protein